MIKSNYRTIISISLLIGSLVLIGVGIADKEVLTVFQKAVNICMECIGIG